MCPWTWAAASQDPWTGWRESRAWVAPLRRSPKTARTEPPLPAAPTALGPAGPPEPPLGPHSGRMPPPPPQRATGALSGQNSTIVGKSSVSNVETATFAGSPLSHGPLRAVWPPMAPTLSRRRARPGLAGLGPQTYAPRHRPTVGYKGDACPQFRVTPVHAPCGWGRVENNEGISPLGRETKRENAPKSKRRLPSADISTNGDTFAATFIYTQRTTFLRVPDVTSYRGTSLIRNSAPVGPYRRTMPRALWWS